MKVLILGATGTVGRELVTQALERGAYGYRICSRPIETGD